MRRALTLAALLISVTVPARAADNAERAIQGFSPDGRYFAFEQYGVQDGSGFPYSDIFIIDLTANAWLPGSPVRARVDDESQPVSAARDRSSKAAQALLAKTRTVEPGELLASQMPTQAASDRHKIDFDPYFLSHMKQSGNRYTLSVELMPFAAPPTCDAEDGDQFGFRLVIADNQQNVSQEVYRDKAIPSSRYCPRDYDISDVVAYRLPQGGQRHVALIGVYTPGFEGFNRRLIAVPFALP